MKKIFKSALMLACSSILTFGLAACGSDDDNKSNPAPTTPSVNVDYTNKAYGDAAMDGCDAIINQMNAATRKVLSSELTEAQEAELQATFKGVVEDVIIPTYTNLADAAIRLQQSLGDLTTSQITQKNIDDACAAFKEARAWWEKSEAFLGGAASDFDIDPTIDSWPFNRDLAHTYFKTGQISEEAIEDASILGFHALEFILFRDGKSRTVAEFQTYDTYKGFTDIQGSVELEYAEAVAKLLVIRCCQLQVSWEINPNAERLALVQAAELDYQTIFGQSFGTNMIKNGESGVSTFDGSSDVLQQLLNYSEGSCAAIADEVGSGKIGHPFKSGYIFYVESPYSHNSITDFANNIRSIENVWYGNLNGAKGNAAHSFHNFFSQVDPSRAQAVESAIANGIASIEAMPAPFVKYVSTIWNKSFEDDKIVEIPE